MPGARVTFNFFELLGVKAALGRTFTTRDAKAGTANVVVLSDPLWRRRFGADARVIGRSIRLGETPVEVIGVLPPGFKYTYPKETEAWTPFTEPQPSVGFCCEAVARLKPGVTIPQAQDHMQALASRLAREHPDIIVDRSVHVVPLADHAFGRARTTVLLPAAVVGLLLLIACANVANLLLARTLERARELAVRSALGAGRVRLIRQLLTEGMLLGIVGGLAGVACAAVSLPFVRTLMPPGVPRVDELRIDGLVLAFAVAVTLATAMLASLVPAWHGARLDVERALKESGPAAAGGRGGMRWRRVLLVGQVSLLVTMLLAAGLLLHSFWRLQQVPLGFDPADILSVRLRLTGQFDFDERSLRGLSKEKRWEAIEQYDRTVVRPRLKAFGDELLARVRALPGVIEASLTSATPLRGTDWAWVVSREDGRVVTGGGDGRIVNGRQIDPDYFRVIQIKLLRGRAFSSRDRATGPRVCILSESLARLLFPGENPIGKRVAHEESMQIVGIVEDVRSVDPAEAPHPAIYVPRAQHPSELVTLTIRARRDIAGLPAAVRSVVQSIDPNQPIDGIDWLDSLLRESMAEQRFYGVATATLAILGLLLAVVGLYGVLAASVAERTREIGIRMAVGAERRDIVRLLVTDGLRPVILGVLLGSIAALWTTRLLRHLLFEVEPSDPATLIVVVALLIGTATVACYVPTRRATSVDPAITLRAE